MFITINTKTGSNITAIGTPEEMAKFVQSYEKDPSEQKVAATMEEILAEFDPPVRPYDQYVDGGPRPAMDHYSRRTTLIC